MANQEHALAKLYANKGEKRKLKIVGRNGKERTVLGLVGGGGVEIRWPQSALALEARYTAGLRSVLPGVTARNRAFGVVLALTF